jgi:iron(III) transport system substrate-binding protein
MWFGLSKRARVIVRSDEIEPELVRTYEQLAEPALKGKLLIRSSQNIYNQSLVASLIAHHGEEKTQAWAKGVVSNLARRPQGGDSDQIRAAAAGAGDAAVVNHYYFARMLSGDDEADRKAAERLELVFPNQDGRGTHVNVSGAGLVKGAPNREAAMKLLEFLTTAEAQRLYAVANHEYPVVEGVELSAVLKGFGDFKEDELSAAKLGEHNREAVRIMDRAGWR